MWWTWWGCNDHDGDDDDDGDGDDCDDDDDDDEDEDVDGDVDDGDVDDDEDDDDDDDDVDDDDDDDGGGDGDDTVDGQTPAPPRMMIVPLFIGFEPSQVVQDFFRPDSVQYWCWYKRMESHHVNHDKLQTLQNCKVASQPIASQCQIVLDPKIAQQKHWVCFGQKKTNAHYSLPVVPKWVGGWKPQGGKYICGFIRSLWCKICLM